MRGAKIVPSVLVLLQMNGSSPMESTKGGWVRVTLRIEPSAVVTLGGVLSIGCYVDKPGISPCSCISCGFRWIHPAGPLGL